ncbi:hypothetical protein AQUCO_01300529v1, partial [Aquilegia coerulea]
RYDLLIDINDYIRFGAVCRWPWRCVYTENLSQRQCRTRHQLPLLMIPSEPCNFKNQTRSLYSLSEKRVLSNFHVKVPHNSFCRGSCQGWLVTLDEKLSDVRLLNPFLSQHNEIELPTLTTFPHQELEIYNDNFLKKAVLSANPTIDPNYVVMAIYGPHARLAFCKPGDKMWTPLLHCSYSSIEDVIYFKDQFYAVGFYGIIYSCDVTQPQPKVVTIAAAPTYQVFGVRKYLVDSFGDLLQISRRIIYPDDEPYYTSGFEVFRLEQSTVKWSKIKDIGDSAIFLGDNHSLSLASQDFPVCKPNCIYFTDNYYEGYYGGPDGPHDMGVFNIENGSIEPHYPLKTKTVYPDYPPPIWIEPTLQQ